MLIEMDGRLISVMASHNIDAIVRELRTEPATSVEVMPVTLKEVLLESIASGRPL